MISGEGKSYLDRWRQQLTQGILIIRKWMRRKNQRKSRLYVGLPTSCFHGLRYLFQRAERLKDGNGEQLITADPESID
jgi:hypothetical protein